MTRKTNSTRKARKTRNRKPLNLKNLRTMWRKANPIARIGMVAAATVAAIAAIAIMVACLILTGTVTLIAYNIDLSIVDLQQSNEIVVWIDENLTTREAKDLQPQFEKISNIATVEFEDRDVALEKYREELGEDSSIL